MDAAVPPAAAVGTCTDLWAACEERSVVRLTLDDGHNALCDRLAAGIEAAKADPAILERQSAAATCKMEDHDA